MKKIFALVCAIVLLPNFSAHAWIGGPFSNNSFFGNEGDDGVYEAVAYPVGGAFRNGIGIFRWGVANTSAFPEGATVDVTQQVPVEISPGFFILTETSSEVALDPVSSNIYFGGYGQISHSWFIEGISYRGNCDGSVNSGLNSVSCVGIAFEPNSATLEGNDRLVSSGFTAKFEGSGEGLPLARFSGSGTGRYEDRDDPTATQKFNFICLGTRVSNFVSYAGILDSIN